MDGVKNFLGMKKSQSQNRDGIDLNNQSRQGTQYKPKEPQVQVTQSMITQLAQMFNEMGMQNNFTEQQIYTALKYNEGDTNRAMDTLLSGSVVEDGGSNVLNVPGQIESSSVKSANTSISQNDPQSVNQGTNQNLFMAVQKQETEPIPMNERYREANMPSGMKNIGNTCYFSSLMQVLFFLPNFTEKILSFPTAQFEAHFQKIRQNPDMDNVEKIKMIRSWDLVKEMQFMFAGMLLSNVKYQNPTNVLQNIVDDSGQAIPIFEQADIGEFFLNFLDRLQDGFCENKKQIRKMMGNELAVDMRKQSIYQSSAKVAGLAAARPIYSNQAPGVGDDAFSDNQLISANPQMGDVPKNTILDMKDSLTSAYEFQFNHNDHHQIEVKNEVGDHFEKMISDYQNNQCSLYDSGVRKDPLYAFVKQASMIDPDKASTLMNYNLDEFKNSMWENFLGSQVQYSKTYEADGTFKVTNTNSDKMGPVQLRIEESNLYQAWERCRRSEIDIFEDQKPGQSKRLETWVCRPPNMLMFQLNRVQYDMQAQKLVKDNGRFDFDKEIYLDLFLNSNKERSDSHMAELMKNKEALKKLKDQYAQMTENNDIVQKFSDCIAYMDNNAIVAEELKANKPMQIGVTVGGPSDDSPAELLNDKSVIQAQIVMKEFQNLAKDQQKKLKTKIEALEKKVEQPYTQSKEYPYSLHAIMIHDGLAENGHYYVYVYDRFNKCWWKLNDHRVDRADEAIVMEEALGNSKGYKSACNLFYINKHILDQINQLKVPLYSEKYAALLPIRKEIRDKIKMDNCKFELETQNFYFNQIIQKIQTITKERMVKIEQQEVNLESILQLKLYSFPHYLRMIEQKGYSKWVVLNQVVFENHPQKLDIFSIVNDIRDKSTPKPIDEIYTGLQKFYPDKFLFVDEKDLNSLKSKQLEFKSLLKKSVLLTFMFQNFKPIQTKQFLTVFEYFRKMCKQLQDKFNNYERIKDFDGIAQELVQMYSLYLIMNILLKYQSSKDFRRKDAMKSASLCAIIASQWLDKRKPHYRQFEQIIQDVNQWCMKQKQIAQRYIGLDEIEFYSKLIHKLKTNGFSTINEQIVISTEDSALPEEVLFQFEKIDALDCNKFVDGIDIESPSFVYFNILNQFRNEQEYLIKIQSVLHSKGPFTTQQFLQHVQQIGYGNFPSKMFEDDYDQTKIVGPPKFVDNHVQITPQQQPH